MKKFLHLFSAAVFSALFVLLSSTGAEAAVIPAGAVTVDYNSQVLTVKESTAQPDQQIYFAVPTIKNVRKKDASGVMVTSKVMTSSTWDVYDYDRTNGAVIDLSWLNRKKDNYIQLKGDKNTDPITIKIPSVMTKVAASFNAAAAVFTMNDITDRKQPSPITDKLIEYRTQYSSWMAYDSSKTNLSKYQVKGAALFFRLSAHKTESLDKTDSSPAVTDMVDADGRQISVYEAGCFPGIELKVAVKKRAGAPKIAVDYNRHQFTLPKNTEYRVISGSRVSAWVPVGAAALKLNLSDISSYINGSTATLEVRTAATAANPCSLSSRLDFAVPETLTVHTELQNVGPSQILQNDVSSNGVGVNSEDCDIYVAYVYKQATKQLTGLRFYNTSAYAYEVFISKNGEAPTPLSKVHTIRAKAPSSTKDVEVTIGTAYVQNGDRIYIRKKADVKNKVWSSYFIGLGTVDFVAPDYVPKGAN